MNCTPEEHPSLSAQNIVLPLSLFRSQLPTQLNSLTHSKSGSKTPPILLPRSSPLLSSSRSTDSHPDSNAARKWQCRPSVCGRQMISVDIRHISADRLPQAGGPRRRTTRHASLPRRLLLSRLTPSPHSINLSEREHGSLMWSR